MTCLMKLNFLNKYEKSHVIYCFTTVNHVKLYGFALKTVDSGGGQAYLQFGSRSDSRIKLSKSVFFIIFFFIKVSYTSD